MGEPLCVARLGVIREGALGEIIAAASAHGRAIVGLHAGDMVGDIELAAGKVVASTVTD
jgi:hypothetical protein